VPPGDSEALAEALRTLVERRELGAVMGAAGRARVQAEFTADRMAERTMRVYEEVLRG
jgi:glycosyltransferase involved in cell wall biosynthesis